MSRLVTDIHLVKSPQGPYFIGNLQFPANVAANDIVVKVYPANDKELNRALQEAHDAYTDKLVWTIELEPRRPSRNEVQNVRAGEKPRL